MEKQTWYQKEQLKKRNAAALDGEHTQEHAHHKPEQVKDGIPAWVIELVKVLEAIWAALPASQSEPNHPVNQKLGELRAKFFVQ